MFSSVFEPSLLLDAIAAAVLVCNETHILYSNPTAQRMLGISTRQAKPVPLTFFLEPQDAALFRDALHRGERCNLYWRKTPALSVCLESTAVRVDAPLFDPGEGATWVITLTQGADEGGESFWHVFDELPILAAVFDVDGTLLRINHSWKQILGWSLVDTPVTVSPLEALYPDPTERAQVIDFILTWEGVWGDFHTHTADGRQVSTSWFTRRLDDNRIFGLALDITHRRIIEEALRESEHIYRALFSQTYDAVFRLDLTGDVIDANDRASELLGYSREEILQKGYLDLLVQQEHEAAERVLLHLLEGGQTPVYERRFISKSGRVLVTEINAQMVYRTDGRPWYIQSIVHDITRRKAMEETLRESQQRYNGLVERIPGMVYRFRASPDGTIQLEYISPRCLDLNGIPAEDALRNPMLLIQQIHPDDLPAYWRQSELSAQTQSNFLWEGRALVNGELRWRRLEATTEQQPDGSIIWNGIQVDTTALHRAQEATLESEQLRLALHKEHELSHLKTSMMVRISHEFRTPLSIISTSSQLLQQYFHQMTPERRDQHFHRIQVGIAHLVKLLDDISLVVQSSREVADYKPAETDLTQLIRDIITQRHSRGRTRHILFEAHSNPLVVQLDEALTHAIVSNLLSNALKFSSDDSPVKVRATAADAHVVIEITDSGIGIPPEEQERIFEPFFRGSRIGEIPGLGLGLTIVRNAVEQHFGSIHVHSVPNEGTTFTVRLPISD
ncbi:MAG: PAS domain S-box protein [bacterium]|nr:PAS domain S-box protein [bacterium]